MILISKINVKYIIENLYTRTPKNKEVINTKEFKTELKKVESDFLKFINNGDLDISSDLFPKECVKFEIKYVEKETILMKRIDKNFMESLYNDRLRGTNWEFFKKIFYNLNTCMYCGQFHAKTLDHVLPSSKFIKHAIIPANLVRSCSTCNGKKSSFVPSSAFYYPYYHGGLYKDIKISGVKVKELSFEIDYELVRKDFEEYINKLGLYENITGFITDEIANEMRALFHRGDSMKEVLESMVDHRPILLELPYMEEFLKELQSKDEAELKGFFTDLDDLTRDYNPLN